MKKTLKNSKKKVPTTKIKLDIKYPIYCIGQKYFQQDQQGKLHPTTFQILTTQYGAGVKDYITYCLTYVNEPSHTNYKQVYADKYNTYNKMQHTPLKGEWKHIEGLLKHIFVEQYQMGLEYFWNLYLHPKQKLPFLGLVSAEKGTGKSTFLNFLHLIFKGNSAVVTVKDFEGNFNSSFASALICTSDEHDEQGKRGKITQKLKNLITETIIRVEAKHQNAVYLNWYGKMIFSANDEDGITHIEPENTRFWIRKISKLTTDDFDFLTKLKNEIPAFLYFLGNEFDARPTRGRLYFEPSEFENDASRNVQANSKSDNYNIIKEALIEWFENNQGAKLAYATASNIFDLKGVELTIPQIRDVVKKEFKLSTIPNRRYTNVHHNNVTGTPFIFYRQDFVDDATEIAEDDEMPF